MIFSIIGRARKGWELYLLFLLRVKTSPSFSITATTIALIDFANVILVVTTHLPFDNSIAVASITATGCCGRQINFQFEFLMTSKCFVSVNIQFLI